MKIYDFKSLVTVFKLFHNENSLFFYFLIFLGFSASAFEGMSLLAFIPLAEVLNNDTITTKIPLLERLISSLKLEINIYFFVILIIFLTFFKCILNFFDQYLSSFYVEKKLLSFRRLYIHYLVNLKITDFQTIKSGKVSADIQLEIERVGNVLRLFLRIVNSVIYSIVALGASFLISYNFTLLAILGGILKLIIIKQLEKPAKKNGLEHSFVNKTLTLNISNSLQHFKFLKIMTKKNFVYEKISTLMDKLKVVQKKRIILTFFQQNLDEFLTTVILAVIICISFIFLNLNLIELGIILIFLNRILVKVGSIGKAKLILERDMNVLDSLNQRLQNWKTKKYKNGNKKIKSIETIQLKNVSYNIGKKQVIRKFNFKFEKGNMYLIQGRSGCGKSTLLDIIMGIKKIQSGSVIINKEEINDDYDYYNIFERMSYVPQELVVYGDSIIDNIVLDKRFPKSKISRSLEIAQAKEFINKLPDGIDTKLDDSGRNFSTGQIQRISIARGILHLNDILLIDESLANIDVQTQKKILLKLKNDLRQKIIIIVSHQLKNKFLFKKTIKL